MAAGQRLAMEARQEAEMPGDKGWQFEPKWDGFRCLAIRDGEQVEMLSRSGKDLARYFPDMVAALKALKSKRFILDGELAFITPILGSFTASPAMLSPRIPFFARNFRPASPVTNSTATPEIEALVLNKDIGFVSEGQPATVKLDAFPFTRFGTVVQVSRDANNDEKLGLVYPVRVRLDAATINVDSKRVQIYQVKSNGRVAPTNRSRVVIRSDQVQRPLGLVRRDLLGRQHVGDYWSTESERRYLLAIVLDRLAQLELGRLTRACPQLSQAIAAARWIAARKLVAVLSYRVAMARNRLRLQ